MQIDRERVEDTLEGLAAEFGIELNDKELNDLTHFVADVFEASVYVVSPTFQVVQGNDAS